MSGIFEINDGVYGEIASVKLSTGELLNSITALVDHSQTAVSLYYGEGVHRISVALNSMGVKFRVLSKSRSGEVLKIKLKKSTYVDLRDWNVELRIDDNSFKFIKEMANDGVIQSSPTARLINRYRTAVLADQPAVDHAIGSKISLMESWLSSKRIPDRGFKPAYSGGLLASPAESRKVYENVISYDIASAYPHSAVSSVMPYGESKAVSSDILKHIKIVNGEIDLGANIGFIGQFEVTGLKLKDWVRVPMIKNSDESFTRNAVFGNDGLISGDISIAMSPADLKLMTLQYDFENIDITILEAHELKPLPAAISDFLISIYHAKENAKTEAERSVAKTDINSIIGVWGIDPFSSIKKRTMNSLGDWVESYHKNIAGGWAKYAGFEGKKGYISGGMRLWDFRWAVYALAETRLKVGMMEKELYDSGYEVLYCDTDSLKFIGKNKRKAARIMKKANKAIDLKNAAFGAPNGMGAWIDESAEYEKAIFIKKKFYAHQYGSRIKPHVAGIYKKDMENIFKAVSLEEMVALDDIDIATSRPSVGEVPNDPFGAKHQLLSREITFRF